MVVQQRTEPWGLVTAYLAMILGYFSPVLQKNNKNICCGYSLEVPQQEAHGPRFAHLSDIATTDMQMLCNIFPILSSQLMKISSFEQFLVLKKNIWAWQSMEHDHLNKLSITFQQKDQCEIWWKLAKWFLKNHDFIHVNCTVAGKYYKYKPDDGHLRF